MENASEMFVPGLKSLVWPRDEGSFLRDYWQKQPLYVKGTPGRLAGLAELFFGFDVERIVAAADLRRTVVQPPLAEQRRRSPHDRLPAPMPEGKTLLLLYALGSQLYLATSGVPGVDAWVERLSRDLGRVWSAGRGDIYATRRGGGADTHFDQNDNFTIQLAGHKAWYFSREPYYAEPLHNSGDVGGVPYDPTYAFDPGRVDTTGFEEVVLGPGDMFYMPRGFLHGTRADEDSLSFNLSLDAQPWADVLLEGLRAYLIRDPRLREGAVRDPGAARARLDLLKELVAGVAGDDLLASPEHAAGPPGRRSMARRNPLSWWACPDPHAEPLVTIEIRTPDRSAAVFQVSPELLALLRALPEGPGRFCPDELLRGWHHDQDAGRSFLEELVSAGLIDWAEAAPA